MTQLNAGAPVWPRFVAFLVICALSMVAWAWFSASGVSFEHVSTWLRAQRNTPYALPAVVVAFIALGLMMVPVTLLIAATGIAFGPLLGPIYAMAGCLASASTGFAIGRWLGLKRATQLGGDRIVRATRTLQQNGTLAVFLARKIPAPFTLINIVIGASTVRFRDFIIGTALGMVAFVIGLAGFGYQLTSVLRDPSADALAGAALFVLVPLTLAVLINHALRRARPAE